MIDANAKTILNAAATICREEATAQVSELAQKSGKITKDEVRPVADALLAEHALRAVVRRG